MSSNPASVFTPEQFNACYPDGIENHWWSLARGNVIAQWITRHAASGSTVLEIGCGRGAVIKHLRDRGIPASGVELATVEPLPGVHPHVRTGEDARELPLACRLTTDILLLLDVIEHLRDPISTVEDLLRYFPDTRHLLITVPAGPKIWSNYDEFYGHYRRYSRPMLLDLGTHIGSTKTTTAYFFHSLYPLARLLLLLRKRRSPRIIAPSRRVVKVHRLIGALMTLDSLLLPRYLLGTSAIAHYLLDRETASPLARRKREHSCASAP